MAKRLTCRIPESARTEIERIAIRYHKNRVGKAMQALMELARRNASHPITAFDGSERPCAIDVPETFVEAFVDYQEQHQILSYTELFKNTLLRGVSVHIAAQNGRGEAPN